MGKLDVNWLTQGQIDFEYKQYQLLSYFKQVKDKFQADRLYPSMSDLVKHYQLLMQFKSRRKQMRGELPKELKGVDLENFTLEYDSIIQEPALFKEIDMIIDYAVPKFENHLEEGRVRYDSIEDSFSIYPIGLISLYKEEGFLILNQSFKSFVFQYEMNPIELADEKHKSISTLYLGSYTMGYSTTYSTIRKELIKQFEEFDNPATYVIETNRQVPIKETFLPIAKRSFLKYLLVA